MTAEAYGFALDVEARCGALHVIRALAILGPLPVFGQGVASTFSKVGVGTIVGVLAYLPRRDACFDPGPEALALVLAAAGEILFGLLLGWTARVALLALRIAGDLVSQEMGLNLAAQFDPATGQSAPLIGHLYESVGLVLFFVLGAHHAVMRGLFASFDAQPAGRPAAFERLAPAFLNFGAGLLEAAFRMAAPAFFALLLISIVLAFFAKVAPQWHLMDAGYPLRAAVGLGLIGLSAPILLPLVDRGFARMTDALGVLVRPA